MTVPQPAPSKPPSSVISIRETPAAFNDPCYRAFVGAAHKKFTRHLTYIGGDPEVAEEAALDGLIDMADRWHEVCDRTERDRERCAMRFAFNRLRDALRVQIRRAQHEPEPADAEPGRIPVGAPAELAEWQAEFQDRVHLLRMVMPQLFRVSPIQAETVYLRYLREYEVAEVAETLGGTPAAVRSNLRHGLSRLRRLIEDLEKRVGPDDEGGRIR